MWSFCIPLAVGLSFGSSSYRPAVGIWKAFQRLCCERRGAPGAGQLSELPAIAIGLTEWGWVRNFGGSEMQTHWYRRDTGGYFAEESS
jgi:hypothetical protein